jgi:two-component system, chemotaxis family, chemotaxis protein CheY
VDLAMGYNLDQMNVLVVDDNHHMVVLVKGILMALGIKHVHTAKDSADAFEELRNFPADIIICDYNMQPLDGIDFARLVRNSADSPNPYVAILMMTGHSDYGTVTTVRDAGVNEFLAKPISLKSLSQRIIHIIEKPRPFVKTRRYFGPDRRRQQIPFKGPERRKSVPEIAAPAAPAGPLSNEDIDALMNG